MRIVVGRDLLEAFRDAGVCLSYDRDEVVSGKGWLAEGTVLDLKTPIVIEGPCALYGGPYAAARWLQTGGLCSIGAASYSHSPVPEGLTIGRYCSIGRGVRFVDFAHPATWASTSIAFFRPTGVPYIPPLAEQLDRIAADTAFQPTPFDPKEGKSYPHIGNDVWIGDNAALAMGIKVGDGAIIATGAIVTKDVPPYAIVGGTPARVLKMRFDEETVSVLLRSRWWDIGFPAFGGLDAQEPKAFAEAVLRGRSEGRFTDWNPASMALAEFADES